MSWRHNFLIHIFAHSSRQTIGPRDRSMWLITKKNEFWKKKFGSNSQKGSKFPKIFTPKTVPLYSRVICKKKFQKNEFLYRDPDTLLTTLNNRMSNTAPLGTSHWMKQWPRRMLWGFSYNNLHQPIKLQYSTHYIINNQSEWRKTTADGDGRWWRQIQTAHGDGTWRHNKFLGDCIGENRKFSHKSDKRLRHPSFKTFQVFQLGCLRKNVNFDV